MRKIIKLLRNSEQKVLAYWLEEYNTSPGPIDVRNDAKLDVINARAEMKGSVYYSMSKNPRGKAIIIYNIYEDNDKSVGLKKKISMIRRYFHSTALRSRTN
jgi:hypothetical protein